MANYSYQSYSSGGGADAAFQQADVNRDGRVDLNEFRNFVGQNLGGGAAGFGGGSSSYEASFGAGGAGFGAGGAGFGGSSFESSYESSGAGFGGGYDASFAGGGAGGAGSYESVSYSSGGGFGGDAGFGAGAGAGAGFGGGAVFVGGGAGGGAFDSSSSSGTVVQHYATDAQGLFQDPNPQIIRRPAAGGVQTYTQNIKVRFLQPPPVPPPGPLIIREVRPPQPPPPPPLRIRQQAPPLPQPPPLILRERPPQPPASIASQTVIRRLAALPVPPRSVIIERLPPLPPRPRDIIIERWVPYGAQAKRRTIVQRAGAAVQYARPRNVIIQYEPVQVRVVRQFQRLGVVQANPGAYVQQWGGALLDAGSLLAQARSAGVVEDISAPAGVSVGYSAASYGQEASFGGASGVGGGFGLEVVGGGAGGAGGAGYSSYESSSFSSGGGFDGGAAGFGGGAVGFGGAGFGGSSSSYESSSFSSGDFGASGGAGFGAGGYSVSGGFGSADAAFAAADTNRDGSIDQHEFRSFVGQNLAGGL